MCSHSLTYNLFELGGMPDGRDNLFTLGITEHAVSEGKVGGAGVYLFETV